MENKKCTIFGEVFVCKTKYFVHIIINVAIPKGDNSMRGVETRELASWTELQQ
jgi:hypothetical protein